MKTLFRPSLYTLTLLVVFTGLVLSCTEEKYKESTDETLNITEFLRANEEEYSLFLEILDVTDYASFMNTYGTYTLFLPTNDAVNQYLSDLGASNVADVPMEDLQELAKLHIIDEVFTTVQFNDGKIATPSLQGQFLITGAVNRDGQSNITVNKDARIISSNVEVGNGVIHVIDKALEVADQTLAETIDEDPSLSLFAELIRETGWYDTLDEPLTYDQDSISSHVSVLAQTNEVFQEAGFNTLNDLKERYSHLDDPTNPLDSLNLYVAYRIIPELDYLADLAVKSVVLTKAPLEVISVKLASDSLLLNEETFNGVLEPGVQINRSQSDVTASNGVLHYVNDNFFIKKRFPAPVYFDVADQPEFRQLSSVFRKPGNYADLSRSELSEVTWEGNAAFRLGYLAAATGDGAQLSQAWHGDVVELLRHRTGVINNLEFTTPVLIKGRYKVWVSYRQNGRASSSVRALFNGEALPRLINFTEYGNTDLPERVLESQGYKRHLNITTSRFNSRLAGIIEVPTTGRHTITLESLAYAGGPSWIDVIEFRPVDMDQLYPKMEAGGDGLIDE